MTLLVAGGLFAASPAATTDDAPPIWFIVIGGVAALIFWANSKSREKDQKAKAHIAAMSIDEVHEVEYRVLVALRGGPQKVYELTGASEEEVRTTQFLVDGLIDSGDVAIVPDESAGPVVNDEGLQTPPTLGEVSLIEITDGGRRRLREPREIKHMEFVNQVNSTYIRDSTISNSFNDFRSKHDDETAAALARFVETIRATGDEEAIEQASEFLKQTEAEQPNRIVMKSLFDGILRAAPAVAAMTDVVAKIKELIS